MKSHTIVASAMYKELMDDFVDLLKSNDDFLPGVDGSLEILGFPFYFQPISQMNTDCLFIKGDICKREKISAESAAKLVDENLGRHFRGEAILAIVPGSDYLSVIYNVALEKCNAASTLDMIVKRMAASARDWEYILSEEPTQ